jgi:hypothetical protein
MRTKTLSLLPLLGLLTLQTAPAQTPKLVSVGQISRVDKLTKSFEMKSQSEVNRQPNPLEGGITIGTTIGKTRPGNPNDINLDSPGRTFPGTTPRDRPTLGDDRDQQPRGTFRQTVFVTDKTVCKERSKVILCDQLKVNDYLQVTGEEKNDTRGRGIYATEIVKTR